MDNKFDILESNHSNGRVLAVFAFLILIIFIVLFSLNRVINRKEQYVQTRSQNDQQLPVEKEVAETEELEGELYSLQDESEIIDEDYSEPELEINTEL